MIKSTGRYKQLRTEVISGMAFLALVGTPSLRADLRGDLWSEFRAGSMIEALPEIEQSKRGGQTSGWYFSGMKAMLDYDFEKAQKDFTEYKRLSKKGAPNIYNDAVDEALKGLNEGKLQFERFQDIVVIDSYEVDRDDFFRKLRIPLSAGRIVAAEEAVGKKNNCGESAYISEGGDFIMWSEEAGANTHDISGSETFFSGETYNEDGEENIVLLEANVLADGSLSEPRPIDGLGKYPDFPFLTADGTTLYYSAEGGDSVGGRDIFIASRDPQTGEYRTPVNAGFPFNSAADDYLLAIDEENGVGWWATDRHILPDNKIMLYVFILPEGRSNFNGDPEEKRARGVLDDVRITWSEPEKEDPEEMTEGDSEGPAELQSEEEIIAARRAREKCYMDKAAEIRKIKPGQKPRRKDCMIPVAPGKYIYSVEDVNTPQEKNLVNKYIVAEREYSDVKNDLDKARKEYSVRPSKALGEKITGMEASEVKLRNNLTHILSSLYKELKQKH
ncbi:MAG: hypothetical protein K2J15_06005 [Muribaculaceae bacterium]|nr:hypothetical protein [Muribaculaceae bacterium]